MVRGHTTPSLTIGENYNMIWVCNDMIQIQWIDHFRTAATHARGIAGMRRIAEFALWFHVRIASHGAPHLSPISCAAQSPIVSGAPNIGIQEFVGSGTYESSEVFSYTYPWEDYSILVGHSPCPGVNVNQDAAAMSPHVRPFLPGWQASGKGNRVGLATHYA